jgi:CubicO group peptidase (beta-lactamase class C family)
MASVPLSFQPGTAWEYSPAFGFDTLGRVVEVVSGQGIDQFFQHRIFEPLGMRETGFSVPADKLGRVAIPYARTADGLFPGTPIRGLALATDAHNRYFSGGGGLAGTVTDYARFALMLADGGQLDGERILSRRTVGLMASNHIGQLPLDRSSGDMSGLRFGLGVRVLQNSGEAQSLASPGTFGWAGAFGTNSFIDPTAQMVGLLMIQRISDFQKPEADLRSLWPRFEMTAYQALDD